MNVLIAPDKFKGSLTALEVCNAIEAGVLGFDETINVQKAPLADGGEGSLSVLGSHLNLRTITLEVVDPLGRAIEASYLISKDQAYVEMAAASGLNLLQPKEYSCMNTSSFGTGLMIKDAYHRGVTRVYLLVGGSATNDGGMGILSALGIQPLSGRDLLEPKGRNLPEVTGFDERHRSVGQLEFTLVCDVKNVLYGPHGAAYVYAPQKGANSEEVEWLDQGLRNLAQVIHQSRGITVDNFEGSGAAGGVAAGIRAFFPTTIQSGIDTITQLIGLDELIQDSDLVITGEGKLDRQTLEGKVVMGVKEICQKYQKKLAVICGSLELNDLQQQSLGIWKIKPLIREDTTLDQAIQRAYDLVGQRAGELMQDWIKSS